MRGRVLWPLDCFAALAMTMELTQQLLGIALEKARFANPNGRLRAHYSRKSLFLPRRTAKIAFQGGSYWLSLVFRIF